MAKATIATVTQLSRHLGCSREEIRRLSSQGVIEELPGGGFNQDKARLNYIGWLRAKPIKSAKRDKLYEVQTELQQHNLAVRRHTFVAREQLEGAIKAHGFSVQGAAWRLNSALIQAFNVRLDRDTRHLIEAQIYRFLNTIALLARAAADSLEATGKLETKTVDYYWNKAAGEDTPELGAWFPPRPKADRYSGAWFPNSWQFLEWRTKLGLIAAPHRTDKELAKFLTTIAPENVGTVNEELTTVTPALVAKIRTANADSIATMQRAVDEAA